jgi:acetoin utilization protein AcuB
MLVEHIMRSSPVTVTPDASLAEARGLTLERGIRHVLVVDDGRLAGIVSDRDLKAARGEPVVGDIMTRAVITVSPDAPVEEAARIMVRERISALPVTLDERLVGIVTETDVLRLFVVALGTMEPSSRLDVTLGPDRDALADVIRIVESAGTRISSVLTLATPDGRREVVIRVGTIDPRAAVSALAANGYPPVTPWREAG